MEIKVQLFVLEIGLTSLIVTSSPTEHSLFASCAWIFVDLLTILPYTGCLTRRSIRTVIDLSIPLLTTFPTAVLAFYLGYPALLFQTFLPFTLLLCCLYVLFLSNYCFDASNILSDGTNKMNLSQLTRAILHTVIKLIFIKSYLSRLATPLAFFLAILVLSLHQRPFNKSSLKGQFC